jgi:predicted metal-dependent phosphotriesterase family hydrolase
MVPMLLDRGVSQESVDSMLIDNPARIFDIEEND